MSVLCYETNKIISIHFAMGKFFCPRAVLKFFWALRATLLDNRELQMTFYMKHMLIRLENLLREPYFAHPCSNFTVGYGFGSILPIYVFPQTLVSLEISKLGMVVSWYS